MQTTNPETQTREDLVEAFQKRIAAPSRLSVTQRDGSIIDDACSMALMGTAHSLSKLSLSLKGMYKNSKNELNHVDERLMRAQLMLEELGEALLALSERNELELLDALADLSYVVSGTATTYDLPLDAAFKEVHRSNMTKGEVRHAEGIKGKGEGYSAPDLKTVLTNYRSRN